ncbi:MAG: glycosyltransferase [Acidimicrobiales bacterium]|jgi:glycosyltransferase involved in cell wall biosynthesis
MRIHLVGLPHTEFTDDYSWCAFTSLGKTFATMMTRRGHEVYLYGGQHNEAECTEFITCHRPVSRKFHVPDWTPEFFAPMNTRVIKAMQPRIKHGDLILLSMGVVQLPIQNTFPDNLSIEYCVGYGGSTAPCRVFPSEAWRNIIYGHTAPNVMVIRGMASDTVIPHFIEPEKFPLGVGDGGYILFIGRYGSLKGEGIAQQVSGATGLPLKSYGGGGHVVGVAERAELMGGAVALLAPSQYPEPFGLVAVEAQMCGTPAITTPWGAFVETVEPKWRCNTVDDFVAATRRAARLRFGERNRLHQRAMSLYSTDVIAPQYERFFELLKTAVYPEKFQ